MTRISTVCLLFLLFFSYFDFRTKKLTKIGRSVIPEFSVACLTCHTPRETYIYIYMKPGDSYIMMYTM